MTYTWTVTSIVGYPLFEGYTDVVTLVFYTVIGNDGQGRAASFSSSEVTPLDPSAPFIPYPDLTNDIIVGWVQSGLGESGIASIYANLDAKIAAQINPPQAPQSLPIPWVVPPVPDLSAPIN